MDNLAPAITPPPGIGEAAGAADLNCWPPESAYFLISAGQLTITEIDGGGAC